MNDELITTVIGASVEDAVSSLKSALDARGIELFAVIDHAASARKVGLELDDEVVVIFGNPTVGTRLMQEDARVGLDLPLRLLLWHQDGETHIAYTDPHDFAERFTLDNSTPVLDGMTSLLGALVNELQKAAT